MFSLPYFVLEVVGEFLEGDPEVKFVKSLARDRRADGLEGRENNEEKSSSHENTKMNKFCTVCCQE